MLKIIVTFLKKVVLSLLLIYTYNKLMYPISLYIPINAITILLVSFCGIPSILMLVFYSLFCM